MWRLFRVTATADEIAAVIRAARRHDLASVQAMLVTITPQRLLALLCHLAPEGQERPREVRTLETVIVDRARGPSSWK